MFLVWKKAASQEEKKRETARCTLVHSQSLAHALSTCAVLYMSCQEKPFAGANGSGKHNNWSIATDAGVNLLNVGQVRIMFCPLALAPGPWPLFTPSLGHFSFSRYLSTHHPSPSYLKVSPRPQHRRQLAEKSGSTEIFPVIMAAIVKAVDENGDLMRMAIATPGNDFRLGTYTTTLHTPHTTVRALQRTAWHSSARSCAAAAPDAVRHCFHAP